MDTTMIGRTMLFAVGITSFEMGWLLKQIALGGVLAAEDGAESNLYKS
ncbi:MAG: hypothetical protein L0287_11145 [Anaerolineae bacterium]|nr:hypothetical protein [Anaerolineae bacterium]